MLIQLLQIKINTSLPYVVFNTTLNVLMIVQVISAAKEVIDSIDTDELARYFSLKSDPDDEGAEVGLLGSHMPF